MIIRLKRWWRRLWLKPFYSLYITDESGTSSVDKFYDPVDKVSWEVRR